MSIDKTLFPYCNADDATPRTDAAVKLYTTSHADMPSSDFLEFVEGLEQELTEAQGRIADLEIGLENTCDELSGSMPISELF